MNKMQMRVVQLRNKRKALSVHELAKYPLARLYNWSNARGLPTDDQLRAYRQKQ